MLLQHEEGLRGGLRGGMLYFGLFLVEKNGSHSLFFFVGIVIMRFLCIRPRIGVLETLYLGCPSMNASMHASIHLTNQQTEFCQTSVDVYLRVRDELIRFCKVEGSISGSRSGQIWISSGFCGSGPERDPA